MQIRISENIRKYRKERGLTQERLAEIMGVTVGAVSKWEAGASVPDIALIVSLADLFETSVDVLLGYELKTDGMADAVKRIRELRNEKRFDEGASMVEKALERYPNRFEIVYAGSILYCLKGVEQKCKKSYRRALQLLNRSLELIGQNQNEQVNEWLIRNHISDVYLCLEQPEKALELKKKNNVDGLNNIDIGYTLATSGKDADEALNYLSAGLVTAVSQLARFATGAATAYAQKKDFQSAANVNLWLGELARGLETPGGASYLSRMRAMFLARGAAMAAKAQNLPAAQNALREAARSAREFDAAPVYGFQNMKFYHTDKNNVAFDDFGETCVSGIRALVEKEANGALEELWGKIEHEFGV